MIALWLLACAGAEDTGGEFPSPFAIEVLEYRLGEGSGYGEGDLPEVVLGAPQGRGDQAGSLDVLSLGRGGEITLRLGQTAYDNPGPDILIFENPFSGWEEAGIVEASADGETWYAWPCDPYCAGYKPVFAGFEGEDCATDPERAGGDAFDLAEISLASARFVRVRDAGTNDYAGNTGGFDLDAVSVVTDCVD